jgi:hypothetical protein
VLLLLYSHLYFGWVTTTDCDSPDRIMSNNDSNDSVSDQGVGEDDGKLCVSTIMKFRTMSWEEADEPLKVHFMQYLTELMPLVSKSWSTLICKHKSDIPRKSYMSKITSADEALFCTVLTYFVANWKQIWTTEKQNGGRPPKRESGRKLGTKSFNDRAVKKAYTQNFHYFEGLKKGKHAAGWAKGFAKRYMKEGAGCNKGASGERWGRAPRERVVLPKISDIATYHSDLDMSDSDNEDNHVTNVTKM